MESKARLLTQAFIDKNEPSIKSLVKDASAADWINEGVALEHLQRHGANEKLGFTTALCMATRDAEVGVVEALVTAGADVWVKNGVGSVPLTYAIISPVDMRKKIDFYVSIDPDLVNARNDNDETPLHFATRHRHLDAMLLLIKHGADVNASGDMDEWTPLHTAAELGHVDTMSLLIRHGADVKATTAANMSVLGTAVRHGHAHALSMLMSHGADVNGESGSPFPPLYTALYYNQAACIKRLLQAKGVNINKKDIDGYVPFAAVFIEKAKKKKPFGSNNEKILEALEILAADPRLDLSTETGQSERVLASARSFSRPELEEFFQHIYTQPHQVLTWNCSYIKSEINDVFELATGSRLKEDQSLLRLLQDIQRLSAEANQAVNGNLPAEQILKLKQELASLMEEVNEFRGLLECQTRPYSEEHTETGFEVWTDREMVKAIRSSRDELMKCTHVQEHVDYLVAEHVLSAQEHLTIRDTHSSESQMHSVLNILFYRPDKTWVYVFLTSLRRQSKDDGCAKAVEDALKTLDA